MEKKVKSKLIIIGEGPDMEKVNQFLEEKIHYQKSKLAPATRKNLMDEVIIIFVCLAIIHRHYLDITFRSDINKL